MEATTLQGAIARAEDVDEARVRGAEVRWATLYAVGGVGALVVGAMTVFGVITFLAWPPPEGAVTEWFALFERNWLVGMLGLDLGMLVSFLANIPVILALYVVLRRASESLTALATVLGLVAIATYFASSRAFEMLALSRQYAAATTDAQRLMLEAVGQSMLTTYLGPFAGAAPAGGWNYQGTAFNLSFVLWSIAGVLLSIAMLRSTVFGRVVASVGILGNTAALGLFVPVVGVALSIASLPLLLVWYLVIARRLFQLRAGRSTEPAIRFQT
jgi:hypothetical protein